MSKWDKTKTFLKEKIKGFQIRNKNESVAQKILAKIMFWMPNAMSNTWLTIYPTVWRPTRHDRDYTTLQHEGVHLLDVQTFFGLLPKNNRWINMCLFIIVYGFPQIFALLAFLAFYNLWWLLALLFLLPLPAPGRMLAEMRAYRRSVELGRDVDTIIPNFVTSKYYWMWPFKKHTRKMLTKNSPYKRQMDRI